MVLLRFAPSPTGALHLGGLRTALLNHLYARKLGGKWLLRIEDTDTTRSVPGSVEGIQASLAWAGLDYDYGPGRPGSHGPYYQSQRLDLYQDYARRLLNSGHAYRCFCTADRLQTTREVLARRGSNSTYDKACLHLTEEEVARRVRAGEPNVIRFNDGKLPERPSPDDMVFGAVRDAHASLPTDPVLLKTDRFPTYHLANIVDDYEMGITHVFRGEEWLPSLPLHLDLYAALKLQPPRFAHLPLLLNKDGTKMSKRHGAVHVGAYIERGWESDAILNWLALAGWGVSYDEPAPNSEHTPGATADLGSAKSGHKHEAPDSTTVMSLPELIRDFDISALTHRRSVLDPLKLERINQQHLARTWGEPNARRTLAERLVPVVQAACPDSEHTHAEYIEKVILALQGRLVIAKDLPTLAPFFFIPPDLHSAEAVSVREVISAKAYTTSIARFQKRLGAAEADTGAGLSAESVSAALRECAAEVVKELPDVPQARKKFMMTLRHALTGMDTGPSLPDIVVVLGTKRVMSQLSTALETAT